MRGASRLLHSNIKLQGTIFSNVPLSLGALQLGIAFKSLTNRFFVPVLPASLYFHCTDFVSDEAPVG